MSAHLAGSSGGSERRRTLDVWDDSFTFCETLGIAMPAFAPEHVAISEAFAARFILALLRDARWLRWRFPRALSTRDDEGFARWLRTVGARKFELSEKALRKIGGVFRRPPGRKVLNLYAHLVELQERFPLGLLEPGRREFVKYLAQTRGVSHPLSDDEILWFAYEAAGDSATALAVTYLLQPNWQTLFPDALTASGWDGFKREIDARFPGAASRARRVPDEFEARAARTADGVNILSHFCYPSGIQQAALFTREALHRCGIETSCRDVPAGVGTELPNRLRWLGLETHPVTIITIPPVPYLATCYERSGLRPGEGVYRIGYWAWELDRIPDEWIQPASDVDEVWAPTNFVAEAIRASMQAPVLRMLPGVEIGRVQPVTRESIGIANEHYVFMFMFDMASQMHRKNPIGVMRAFRRAFRRDDPATLVVKVSRGEIAPTDSVELKNAAAEHDVRLIDKNLSRESAYGLLNACDCFVSLHRAEGFGLACAEAMLLGKPTIATRYSGNLDYMNDANSMLVDFAMTEITGEHAIYKAGNRWAEPSEEHAAWLMRQAFEDPAAARALGARARDELRETLSLEAAGARYRERLEQINALRARRAAADA